MCNAGPLVVLAVRRQSLTAEGWIRPHFSLCQICGHTGTGFPPSTSVLPCHYNFINAALPCHYNFINAAYPSSARAWAGVMVKALCC